MSNASMNAVMNWRGPAGVMTAPAPQVVVDIGDMGISTDPEDVLVTYSLGSCLGVVIHDPQVSVGGILHCMLPLSGIDPAKAREQPYMFADTGMVLFLQKLFDHGVRRSRAVVKLVGGARILDRKDLFRTGERNYAVMRRLLWKNDMLVAAEDVGGDLTRTVRLEMATGRVTVRTNGVVREL